MCLSDLLMLDEPTNVDLRDIWHGFARYFALLNLW